MRRFVPLVVLLTVLAYGGVAPAGAGGPFPPDVVTELDAVVQKVRDIGAPGTVLAVSVPGEGRYLTASGTAGENDPTPLDPSMHFRIGSNTKTFTATAVLQLVDECLLSLDDPVEQWQPGLVSAPGVTIRNLLNMTSGIPDYSGTDAFVQELGNDPLHVWPPQELIDLVATTPAMFAPGSQWSYTNTNYIILGLIVEALRGQPLETVIQERILDPVGLAETEFPTTPDIPAPGTHGVLVLIDDNLDPLQTQSINVSPSAFWAAGAMTSTVGDLERWVPVLAEGSLLSPGLQAERMTLVPIPIANVFAPFPGSDAATLPAGYGLGLFAAGGYVGHNGDVPGFESIMVHDPATGTTIVQLQNASMLEEIDDKQNDIGAAEIPNYVLPTVAGILGQDPPLPPNPSDAATPTCAATPVVAAPRFTG